MGRATGARSSATPFPRVGGPDHRHDAGAGASVKAKGAGSRLLAMVRGNPARQPTEIG
jgi:hypothetical protein